MFHFAVGNMILLLMHKAYLCFAQNLKIKLVPSPTPCLVDFCCYSLSYEVLSVDISILLYFRMSWSMLSKIWWASLVPSATSLIWVTGWLGTPTLRMCGHLWIQFTSIPRKSMPMHSSTPDITLICVRGWWKKWLICVNAELQYTGCTIVYPFLCRDPYQLFKVNAIKIFKKTYLRSFIFVIFIHITCINKNLK